MQKRILPDKKNRVRMRNSGWLCLGLPWLLAGPVLPVLGLSGTWQLGWLLLWIMGVLLWVGALHKSWQQQWQDMQLALEKVAHGDLSMSAAKGAQAAAATSGLTESMVHALSAMVADVRQANPDGELTLGADKGYDAAEFIKALQDMKVTPHVAQNKSNRKSAVPDEIASTEGYGISMQKRKLIEQGFGWAKFIGPIRQVMVRGIKKVDQVFMMAMAAYNLVRMRTLGQVRLEGA